jgi:hypothetical protein
MSQRVYTIKKAFLVPLGIDTLLLLCLLCISWLSQGSTPERLVFMLFFFPSAYLFLECLFRRITVNDESITLRKLWKEKKIPWTGITHVGGLSLRSKVYILLTTVKGFFIVSNAYERFSELTQEIVSHIDPARVDGEVEQQGEQQLAVAQIATAWVAAVFMIGIILIRILPFMS